MPERPTQPHLRFQKVLGGGDSPEASSMKWADQDACGVLRGPESLPLLIPPWARRRQTRLGNDMPQLLASRWLRRESAGQL
eukprot:2390557-Pyramimonas_sp.AAC.2